MPALKEAKATKRYLVTKQKTLKKRWSSLPKEDEAELKKLIKILAIIFVTVAVLYFVGINLLSNIGEFWSVLRGKSGELFQSDTTAPPPPYLSPVSLYTNKAQIKIEGYAEAGAKVTLLVNGSKVEETVAAKGGQFTFSSVSLKEGENVITATAKDEAKNESAKSSELKVILDKEPPELKIQKPKEGQKFVGEDNKIAVSGKTEKGATVTVNDHQASVTAKGTFSVTIIAKNEGDITLEITATDRAGNETKKEVTVNYSAKEESEETGEEDSND